MDVQIYDLTDVIKTQKSTTKNILTVRVFSIHPPTKNIIPIWLLQCMSLYSLSRYRRLITSRKYHDSCEYTYQVKFNKSFWKHRARNKLSRCPLGPDILYTERHAHAWTGGLTSLKANSYAGSWPFGDMYHSRRKRRSWDFANSGSILAIGIMWKARSQEAYYKIINIYKNDKNEETIRWSR